MKIYFLRFFILGGWFTWWAVGTAVVEAGAKIYSSSKSKASAPTTVPYQNVDPTQVQKNAISGDIATMPDATLLATNVGNATATNAVAQRNITQPGYSALAGNLSAQATKMAADPYAIPQSVVDQLTQYAAENNITEGTGASSGFSGNNLLRSLGINALEYGKSNINQATQALSVLSGTAPNVSPVSPLSFMLTPAQALQTQTTNNQENQAIGQGAANAQAAVNNSNNANLWDTVASAIPSVVSAVSTGVQGSNQAGNAAGAAADATQNKIPL